MLSQAERIVLLEGSLSVVTNRSGGVGLRAHIEAVESVIKEAEAIIKANIMPSGLNDAQQTAWMAAKVNERASVSQNLNELATRLDRTVQDLQLNVALQSFAIHAGDGCVAADQSD